MQKIRSILSNLLWIPKSYISDIGALKNRLIVKSPYEDVEPITTYKENKNFLGIPRNYASDFLSLGYKDATLFPSLEEKIKFVGELKYNQQLAFDKWFKYYKAGIRDVILNLPPRSGKTILTIRIAVELQTPFLVIVPRVPLISQWASEIIRFSSITNGKIGIVRQKQCEYKNMICSIGQLHSLAKDKYSNRFKNYYGLVVFDELHLMGAQEFSKVLSMFPARYRLGLTGTLRRSDKMERVFGLHLGRNLVQLEGKESQPKIKLITVLYNKSSGELPYWAKSKLKQRAILFSLFADNQDRNLLIAKSVNSLYKKGLRTLVIGERIRQLDYIYVFLVKKLGIPSADVNIITGNTSKERREWIIKNSKIILSINSILGVGVTIEGLRGLVFASPLSDVEQAVGRIRNIDYNLPDPVVIDIVDTYYLQTKVWYNSRRRFYETVTYEQHTLKV